MARVPVEVRRASASRNAGARSRSESGRAITASDHGEPIIESGFLAVVPQRPQPTRECGKSNRGVGLVHPTEMAKVSDRECFDLGQAAVMRGAMHSFAAFANKGLRICERHRPVRRPPDMGDDESSIAPGVQ